MADKKLYCLLDWIVFRTGTSIGGWFLCVKIISYERGRFIGRNQEKGDHPGRKGGGMDPPDDPPVVVMIYKLPRAPRTTAEATRTPAPAAGSHTALHTVPHSAPRAEAPLREGGS